MKREWTRRPNGGLAEGMCNGVSCGAVAVLCIVLFARARLAGDRLAAGGAEGAREPLPVAEQAGSATLDEGEGYDEGDVVE